MLNIKNISIPDKSGVYIFQNKNKVLYVGKAKNLIKRVKQYFNTGIGVWKEDMVSKATDIKFHITTTEEEALVLESNLIKQYQPPYNSLLKGDNAYVYIKIPKGNFPTISFTRYKKNDGATYIGPKPWKKYLKNTLGLLRQIFKFRTCSDAKFRKGKLCSDQILGLCDGWCVYESMSQCGNVKTSDKLKGKDEKFFISGNNSSAPLHPYTSAPSPQIYKKNISIIKKFFRGNSKQVQKIIIQKIDSAVEEENYEWANILKSIYLQTDKYNQGQNIDLEENINGYFISIKKIYNANKKMYFMVYANFQDGKIIDVVKLKNDENNFLQEMIHDGIISKYKILEENKNEILVQGQK